MPVYVVVGASRGIGLAFVKQLAAEPANTVIAVNRKQGQESVERLHEVTADLNDLSSLQKAAAEIEGLAKEGVDVLIASAGDGQMSDVPLAEGREVELAEALLKTFQTNTIGHLQFISLLLPQLRRGKLKKIVYLSSPHGMLPLVRQSKFQGRLPYATSKAASDVAIVRIANQLRPEGFTVFSVAPSVVMDREAFRAKGNDPDALERAVKSTYPGHSGILTYEQGAELMLDVIARFGPDDSGRVVGMWGNEEKMG